MKSFRSVAVVAVAVVSLALFIYWIKCQCRVDIFKTIKWEHYLPLERLQRKIPIILAKKVLIPIDEQFNNNSLSGWLRLWSDDAVGNASVENLGPNNSKCAVIQHPSQSRWSFRYDALIEVEPGQEFEYRFIAKTKGEITAHSGLVLFDANQRVIDWAFGTVPFYGLSEWTEMRQSFIIPDKAQYMRFCISGRGSGVVLIDDISLIGLKRLT